jgi:ATP-dependent Lon protease
MENTNQIMYLPLIPLRGLSVYPYMVIHFDVGREKSIKALEEAMINDQKIFLTTQHEVDIDEPTVNDFYHSGTICKIKQMLKLPGDTVRVLVEGINRGKVLEIEADAPFFKAKILSYVDENPKDKEIEALMRACLGAFEKYILVSNRISPDVMLTLSTVEDPGRFCDIMASHLAIKPEQKQKLIESVKITDRLEAIYGLVLSEIEILEVEKKINDKVRGQINKLQKEYYLREQLKVIKHELGEDFDNDEEIRDMYEKLDKLKLNKKIHEKVVKEIERLERMSPMSAESAVARNYVNNILDLPWKKKTKDRLDISRARDILNEDHYGLDKVKERILEYLAVRSLTKDLKGPIICLVGPPGVGKTSIAKSVARSLNRKFVRMSLGGVRDEAEIRGHRRTYIGAIPGRIITNIKEVGTKNPVFLFDEIDKLTSDMRGDPSSALLEVLDPEQNKDFTDHFLEVPFDLSDVMFITTANSLGTIPRPLLDRMEVIEISGYTEIEKLNIAKKYLVSKQLKQNGLKEENLTFSDETLSSVINNYTRESGVRTLERTIGTVCRKVATKLVETKATVIKVDENNIEDFLGKKKYLSDEIVHEDQIGVVTGLAWTPVGGDTLQIEVSIMKGKGKLVLTGQMGDVMKESAQTGLSYIRSIAEEYKLPADFHENNDIHIHIPEGAIPKDGPSAGITMATAMLSALANIEVRKDIAMTGEITLRGRVLPIGGLKEKSLAGARVGVKTILIPVENEKDLDEIPKVIKDKVNFIPVKTMDEVLKHVLVK